jgi:streptogramin lyase
MRMRKILSLGLPGWRWAALAFALVVAGAVATPILAQDATITRWTLPIRPENIALDPSGQVWATTADGSGYDNTMYRLDPANDQLTTYTHAYALGDSLGMAIDSDGLVWFTANTVGGSRIDRLDPATGNITGWPATNPGYAVALDTLSNDVWFNCGSALCRLDPDTNTITNWTLASAPTAVSVDGQGKVWHVRPDAMKVGVLDPLTNSLTEWSAPGTTMSGTPQSIFVDSADKVWFTVWVHSDNDISGGEVVRLDAATNNMTRWPCPPGACFSPSDMLVDGAGDVWFAEWGTKIGWVEGGDGYIDRLDPTANPPVFTRWKVCEHSSWAVSNPGPDQIFLDAGGAAWMLYSGTVYYPNLYYLDRLQP